MKYLAPAFFFGGAICFALSACDSNGPPPPPAGVTTVPIAGFVGNKGVPLNPTIQVSEFCYKGYVYLTTSAGGISPKVHTEPGGIAVDYASVETCK